MRHNDEDSKPPTLPFGLLQTSRQLQNERYRMFVHHRTVIVRSLRDLGVYLPPLRRGNRLDEVRRLVIDFGTPKVHVLFAILASCKLQNLESLEFRVGNDDTFLTHICLPRNAQSES